MDIDECIAIMQIQSCSLGHKGQEMIDTAMGLVAGQSSSAWKGHGSASICAHPGILVSYHQK